MFTFTRVKGRFGIGALFVLAAAATMVFGSAVASAEDIVILYTNDMHGRLEAGQPAAADAPAGGLVKLATIVDQVVAERDGAVLLLNAGDSIHGTNIVNLFSGASMLEAMEATGFRAMTVGNHEFNYGQHILLERAAQADFPFLSANTIAADSGRALLAGAHILTVNGVRVGIFGLSPLDTYTSTHPKNVVGLEFLYPVRVASWMVPYLVEQEKVDLVIALTHIGYDADRQLAEAVPGIDVIVGGHSHTKLDKPEKVGGTVIVSAGEYANYLGRLDITVERGDITEYSGELIPVVASVADDPDVSGIIASYKGQLDARLSATVGESLVQLDGERANVRTRETNLGNLVADVLRRAGGADVGLMNGGGIRASINAGPVTLGEVFTTLPFDNTLVVIEVSGADLKAALEKSVSEYPKQLGGFLQVSGLKFEFDPAKAPGERVISVTIGDEALDPAKLYRVATNDFTAAGGDGYDMFKKARVLFASGEMLRDAMATYMQTAGAVSPSVEGRIVARQP